MKRTFPISTVVLASFALTVLALPACGQSRRSRGGDGDGGEGGDDGSSNTSSGTGGATEAPHALGSISLSEQHASESGSTIPSVSVYFIPNVVGLNAAACGNDVSGCRVTVAAECASCSGDEYCAYGDDCAPTCIPVCNASCLPDEECYFPSPGTPGCRKKESFDAGALTFVGTTVPITLFPPYSYDGGSGGPPFVPESEITVQAAGASGAGFAAFEATWKATKLIQTSLSEISAGTALGSGDIPVSWVPGADKIVITADVLGSGGKSGTVVCETSDATGSFKVPREAIKAAIDTADLFSISLSVARTRLEIKKNVKTKGTLTTVKVEPVGWVNLVTTSTESSSYSCGFGESVCNGQCINVDYDSENCGACGKKCNSSDSCSSGTCVGPYACNECASDSVSGGCKPQSDACKADAECSALLSCINGCQNDSCISMCYEQHQASIAGQQAIRECICYNVCSNECSQTC